MFHRPLRPTLRLIAIYSIICLFWVGLASWVAPNIAAHGERNPSMLNVTAAALLAVLLHLLTVLLIRRFDRKHRGRFLEAAGPYSRANTVLVLFSAVFLGLAVLSGAQGDYAGYLNEWKAILAGRNPWESEAQVGAWVNSYGPLFNLLAPLAWVNPLANKLLFAFAYIVYVIWLIKDFAPRRKFVTLPWPWVGLWLLNPFPWEQIAYYGYFDVLVGIACVAAVHSLARNKDGASGIYLASGILLKYMPIVVLPFLAFNRRRVHFRLIISCVGVIVSGLVVSVLVWGTSTFNPLKLAATRESILSIYIVLSSTHSPLRPFLHSLDVDWLDKPLLLIAGLGTFTWCVFRQIEPALSSALAILITLLFYRVGYANYQMVFFSVILYWAASNLAQFKEHSALVALLVGYFCFLAISNLALWWGLVGSIFYSNIVVVLLQFLFGCALLVCLARLRPKPYVPRDANGGEKSSEQSY